MAREYMAQYFHRTSPKPDDIDGPFTLPDTAFANLQPLAKAMRKAGILASGERVKSMRYETDGTLVFLARNSPWHAIKLTEGAFPAKGVDYPGYNRRR